LLSQFRLGEAVALTRVYYAYVSDVLAFLKRGFVFNAGEKRFDFHGYKEPWHLESAVQEVFIKAFSMAARTAFDGIRPYRNYLFRIARNSVIDDFRNKKGDIFNIQERVAGDDDRVLLDKHEPFTPERELVDKQLMETVERYIDQLAAEIQPFFNARFKKGESVESCARRFGWSEYRVKREEKRIKKRFFSYLKESGYFEGYGLGNRRARNLAHTLLLMAVRGCR
jgi:RNA polymerase sigma factor (sigma-70 family)